MLYAQMFVFNSEDRGTKQVSRNVDAPSKDTITNIWLMDDDNTYLTRLKPVYTDVISIDVPYSEEKKVRYMLRKGKHICSTQLGDIKINTMRIDLSLYAKTFQYPPFRFGLKQRELKLDLIDRQLKDGILELTMSEYETTAMLLPTNSESCISLSIKQNITL